MSLKQLETIFVKAIDRTKELIFPFSFKKWIILAFIAMLGGGMGSGSFNISIPDNPGRAGYEQRSQGTQGSNGVSAGQLRESGQGAQDSQASANVTFQDGAVITGIFIAFLVFALIAIPIWLLFLWIGARFAFIFYHSAVFRTTSIASPWEQYKMQGNSLFKVNIVLALLSIFVLGSFGVIAYLMVSGGNYTPLFVLIPLGLFLLLSITLIFHYIAQFVVPIMAIEKEGFADAFGRFKELFAANKKHFILYVFVALGLGIACGFFYALLCLGICIVFLIIGLVIFGGGYAVFGAGGIFILLCVLMGLPFVLGLLLSLLLAAVPFGYFFRNFTLYYLMCSPCDYDFYGDREVEGVEGVEGKEAIGLGGESNGLPSAPSDEAVR